MLAVKGIYKDGKVELLESIGGVEEAELYIVVVPRNTARGSIGIISEEGKLEDFPDWTVAEWNKMALTSIFLNDEEAEVVNV